MEMMGATVETGTKTLKDAVDAAFGAWMSDLEAFYVLGFVVTILYPTIVHEFQKVTMKNLVWKRRTKTNQDRSLVVTVGGES